MEFSMDASEYRDSDTKYLDAIVTHPDPVVTATEVATAVDVTQQAAYDKLVDLERRGYVTSKKVGSRARVWWPTPDGRTAYAEHS